MALPFNSKIDINSIISLDDNNSSTLLFWLRGSGSEMNIYNSILDGRTTSSSNELFARQGWLTPSNDDWGFVYF